MTSVLVTGARGFVGAALVERLARSKHVCRGAVRRAAPGAEEVSVGDIDGRTDWRQALDGIDAVVHCAARVHQTDPRQARDAAAFDLVNRDGTMRLAQQALEAGVRRFVFLSSIKVNGDRTLPGRPFRADDMPMPTDAYGASKLAAELELKGMSARGMETVVIRPPLVYGPGVRANFRTMLIWLAARRPLPFGAVRNNRRSLIALDNLVDFVVACLDHPDAPGRPLLPSDGEDLSTAELLVRLGRALGRPALLLPVPVPALRLMTTALGRQEWAERLFGSLQVDSMEARSRIGWRPPVRVDDALIATAQAFLREAARR